MRHLRPLTFIVLFIQSYTCFSQKADSVLNSATQFPEKYFSKVDSKISSIDAKLTKQTEKYLQKLQREESKIQRHLQEVDSAAAATLAKSKQKFTEFSQKIKSKTAVITKIVGGQYNSYLDSLGTSLSFLKQFNGLADKVKGPLKDLNDLQSKLQETEKIKEFIAQQKEQIKQLLSKYANLPGLKKAYENLSKTAYYYSAQIKEYKEMLKDPKKVEQKALSLLNKLPAFQKFFKQNSQLASLFGIPGSSPNTSASLAGLQTRESVQSIIQQQISIGGPNAQAQVQQNLAQAHAEIDKLKDQINKFGGSGSDITMPDFKINSQKTKSFFKRLEYGSNVQFAKSNNLLPTTANIGLSLGYKLNDKSIIGLGGSYMMGMGTIQHIQISHQGVGLRSFVDYKLKKQFFVSGGYEMNYNAAFKNIQQLKDFNAWQTSGLIGLSKKYKAGKKVNGEMKLLYDFLAYDHTPVSQPFVFRLGYTFK